MPDNCHICELASSNDNLILQTNHWRIILADDQAYLGRSFITLRTHKASLTELSPEAWLDFQYLVAHIETGYEQAFGSGRPFNWACMMNNAFQQPEPAPHVHWHLRPRHAKAVTVNGLTFTDAEYAHHYDRDTKQIVDRDTRAEILRLLKQHL